jgi:hypothetical protein
MSEQLNPENDIIVSFDDVKMKDFRAYWKAVAHGDWQGQDAFFAKVVKSWVYEGDPSDADAYGELNLKQFMAVQKAIKSASTGAGVSLWSDFKS